MPERKRFFLLMSSLTSELAKGNERITRKAAIKSRRENQVPRASRRWEFSMKINPCTPESRKRGRRNPLEVLKSQEFVGGRVGTNSGSWCAESRSLSGNSHEKKRKKEISTLGIFFGSDEKKNVCRNLMSKRKEKTPTYLEPSETAYSGSRTITKQKGS